jgi:hypothetical protein
VPRQSSLNVCELCLASRRTYALRPTAEKGFPEFS